MRSLQDYRNIYAEVARNYDITGDSVELLVQLLANASYISEVEGINYTQEASLERATLVNSKIQHCMDRMYSVFRGRCPRVIMNIKPTKYMKFDVYDTIVTSNDFKVYYLGYLNSASSDNDGEDLDITAGTRSLPIEEGFIYGPCEISPASTDSDTYTIIGLLAKEAVSETWTTNKNNTYYVETLKENLSSDMYVKIGNTYYDTTRVFSDHILNHYIFDLTTTSWSSRLYIADIFMTDSLYRDDEPIRDNINQDANITLEATYYKFSKVSEYKPAELKRINLAGTEMVAFDKSFLDVRNYTEIAPGVIIISETDREGIDTIHYKANRDRYVGSIIRSNSDVGTVLEETYPTKVIPNGTNYIFTSGPNGSQVNLYYVPSDPLNLLTDSEISDYVETRKAYYIVEDIVVTAGRQFTAVINIDLELYKPYTIDSEISEILTTYEKKFNINLNDNIDGIKTLISKISNVKQVIGLNIMYLDPEGSNNGVTDLMYDQDGNLLPDIYFKIDYNINSIIQTKS